MKKINLFLCGLLAMFCLCNNVNAIGTAGDVISPGNGANYEDGYTNYWPSFPGGGTNMFLRGIRVSIVTSDGKHVASNDYVWDTQKHLDRWDDWGNLQYVKYKYSKASYANGYTMTFAHLDNRNDIRNYIEQNKLFKSLDSLENIFINNKFVAPNVIDYLRKTVGGNSKMDITFARDWIGINNYIGSNYDNDLINLLKNLGVSSDYLLNEEELKDLFMVVEPVSAIVLRDSSAETGNLYYGTFFELVNIISKTNFSSKRFSDLISFVRKELPCSGVLTGRLTQIIKGKGVYLSAFDKNGYYFNNIKITYTTKCTSNLSKEEVLDLNDYGMAVVWLYEFVQQPNKKNPTCNDVNTFLNDDSSNYMCNDYTSFSDLVNRYNDYARQNNINEITVEWYKNCGCKQNPPTSNYVCTPDYGINTCMQNKHNYSVYYKDSSLGVVDDEYWEKCVFNSGNYGNMTVHKDTGVGDLSYLDTSLGDSKYCPVYCIEEITANFDKSLATPVMAGQHFIWPNNTSVTSSRTCRAKITNDSWNKFTSDVNSANQDIKNKYDDWQFEIKKEEAFKNPTVVNNSKSCNSCLEYETNITETYEHNVNCSTRYKDSGEEIGSTCKYHTCDRLEEYKREQYNNGSYRVYYYCQIKKVEEQQNCKKYGNTTEYIARASYNGKVWTYSWCGDETPRPGLNSQSKKQAYNNALNVPTALVERMNNCYGLVNENVLNSTPQLQLEYTQGGYDYTDDLISKAVSIPNSYDQDVKCQKVNNISIYTGNPNQKWQITNPTIYKCSKVEKTNTIKQEFYINENTYRYVLKNTQISLHVNDYFTNYNGQNYIDVGYGNLPISFSTVAGVKDGLKITYSKLGHSESDNTVNTDIDKILSSLNTKDYGNWQCQYEVIDDIIIPPGGNNNVLSSLNLIYRPIDLLNPFPDINGIGRQTGSNWCYNGTDCSNNNKLVQQVITNKTDIYQRQPMYSFELTPVAIKAIRSYNHGTDNIGNKRNYSDYNLTCETGTGEACISNFLQDIINNNINVKYNNIGCMQPQYRVSNSTIFNGCQNK